ncbi:MAG: hypothetical protein FJ398_08670 [Verrucomicrobia bacterium]|nr:hypothetical protein [Verrucomicrobiota bacterium]
MHGSTDFELKPLSREGIPAALDKAVRYRLLNEPGEAESICRDVLRVEPDNQQALVVLLLALTDRFGEGHAVAVRQAQEVSTQLRSEYERLYYAGIICERRAKAQLHLSVPGAGHDAYEWLCEAMDWYEKAEAVRPEGNDDALLRWNACARIIMQRHLAPRPEEKIESSLE